MLEDYQKKSLKAAVKHLQLLLEWDGTSAPLGMDMYLIQAIDGVLDKHEITGSCAETIRSHPLSVYDWQAFRDAKKALDASIEDWVMEYDSNLPGGDRE